SASFEGGWPLPGAVGIASQSGAYGSHLFAAARDRGIGTPVLVTTGNEADTNLADIIGWMAESEEVSVIAAYAEGLRRVTARDWVGAEQSFASAVQAMADDVPSDLMLQRVRNAQKCSPPEDWDGVWS
ncbi:MAG: hypothetical protein NTX28_06520, partial [Novosphingobium sp.]|nr:hypothetical protein [Novosphingobium sp.]